MMQKTMLPQEFSGEGRRRPAVEEEATGGRRRERCPRCQSRDTKFCYYNNYNTSQPRHFCRSCRRYWTLGGALRNVPIGGSSRTKRRHRPLASGPARPGLLQGTTAPLDPTHSSDFGLFVLGEPFLEGQAGLELGLGLGYPTPQLGPGLGTSLMWDTWRGETGFGDCFDVSGLALGADADVWPELAVFPAVGSELR